MWTSNAYGYFSDYLWWWVVLASLIVHTACFFRLWRPGNRPHLRFVLGNALITTCLLVLVGLVAETHLRFFSASTDAYGVTLTSQRWFTIYPKLNSASFRDREWTEVKPTGMHRVAFFGDSFTYGWGVTDQRARFTDLVRDRFQQCAPDRVDVMNVSWYGWGTEKEVEVADKMIDQYDLDEVVLCYLPNDIEDRLPVSKESNPRKRPESAYVNTRTSFVVDYLYHRLYIRQSPNVRGYFDWLWDGYADPDLWQQHTSRLRDFIRECHDRDVVVRVALVPFITTHGERYDAAALHARLLSFFEREDVPVVDLLRVIDGRDPSDLMVNRHDAHPNGLAHRLFADGIWDAFYAETYASGNNTRRVSATSSDRRSWLPAAAP